MDKVAVTVPFWVNGAVRVERTYWVGESWHELCRAVAEDINRAPALQLRPVEIRFMDRDVQLCVDTGSPNGSVAVHYVRPDQWEGKDTLELLTMPIKVERSGWFQLAEPYGFERVTCPVTSGVHGWIAGGAD